VEGLSAIEWKGAYYVCFDHYTNPKYYGAMKSVDMEHWREISSQISLPRGIRHGTVLKVPERIVLKLQSFQKQETTK
jgi:hypothetical protein